jgi:hypothetical protein
MKKLLVIVAVATGAVLAACGGGSDQPLGVATPTTVSTNSTVASAVVAQPFAFASGVPAFGTTSTTTVTFTGTSTANIPAKIETPTGSAQVTTTFGSCIFAVASVTGTVGSLKVGDTITVNPCNMNVNTAGAVANGVATSRSVALVLGAASSAGATVTVGVNPGGQLTLNGTQVGTVTLVPVSG